MGAATRLRGFSDLVGLAYQGVEDSASWKTLMSQLSELTASHDASMVICSASAPGIYCLITDNDDPKLTGSEHVNGVMSVNVLLDLPQPAASTPDELMSEGAFLRTPLYQNFLKPANIRYLLGLDVMRDDILHVKLSVERTADQPPFSLRERELIDLIAPHLQRAIHLREQHANGAHMRYFFEEAMAKLAIGSLMLDARGRVLSMNAWARQLIEQNEVLVMRNGRLRAIDSVDGRALNKAIDLALAAHHNNLRCQRGVGLRLEARPGMALLDVVVNPLICDPLLEARDTPAVVVYLNDCRHPGIELDPAVLAGMYGLTPCESQLSALLAKGISLDEASMRLKVSINTVKTHLRGIYEKLGTNKQAQIVARLNHSSARLL